MTFVTILEGAKNVHLTKDVGQIPYQMHKQCGYDASLVCFRYGSYPYLETEVRGLRLEFLPTIFGLRLALAAVTWFLLRNAKKIDVLNLYHLKKRPIIYGLIYKFLNPHGFLYFKADTSSPEITFRVARAFLPVRLAITFLGNKAIEKADLVSVETTAVLRDIEKVPPAKRLLVPNAFDEDWARGRGLRLKSFEEKEDLLICVGRHGDRSKNSELLLDALRQIDIGQWHTVFVGSATPDFTARLESLLHDRPQHRPRVRACGYVADKKELFEWYNRAKIICLPSRSDTLPIVLVEAIYFGCVIVTTDHLPASQDLTENGTTGRLFRSEDSAGLASLLKGLINDRQEMKRLSLGAMKLSREKFLWPRHINNLNDFIVRSRRGGSTVAPLARPGTRTATIT